MAKSPTISVRVSPELHKALEDKATAEQLDLSELIRAILARSVRTSAKVQTPGRRPAASKA